MVSTGKHLEYLFYVGDLRAFPLVMDEFVVDRVGDEWLLKVSDKPGDEICVRMELLATMWGLVIYSRKS